MTSMCAAEIKARHPQTATMLMDFLIELDRRGVVKSHMASHMNHGFERIWEKA